ncbi:MAG TPA: hypothetical protein VGG10_08740 [Rhizomicrobium sp.]
MTDLRSREPAAEEQVEVAPRPREPKAIVEPLHIDKPRRLFVNLSPQEYERLGIVAVKRDTSRHHLLREAFVVFLEKASDELGHECACVAGACNGACPN